jgi:hypothetical protein
MKGSAYYIDGDDCAYSFKSSTIEGTPGADADAEPLGFTLTYTSEEKCAAGEGKFTYTLNMVCDKDNEGTSFTAGEAGDCKASAELKGK